MSQRYVCIHAHFYQPPRENPWLEAIELQDSAYPYHDWNERITAECYAPNAASRILDGEDRIVDIVNNYARVSFNFGPTLLSWLEARSPEVYQAVLEADRQSRQRFSGHGSAIAQAYNHMILPLANPRDRRSQVLWGIRDFERRFGRAPEGMWLPETAVDLPTLETLAELGLRFTILAPSQARRVRRSGGRAWRDVAGGRIDPTQAYEVRLASGRSLALFFYDGAISRAVAFEGLLHRGEHLADRLASAFQEGRAWPQLVHIANDGETYGHHHRYGEMALSYALHQIESKGLATLTNYAEYLEKHPPTQQVEILEQTAWSCVHGVGRWWRDCGCHTGTQPGWNQAWREPLRGALDWLRDTVAPAYEEQGRALLQDPWAARDDYVEVILDRGEASRRRFLARHAARELDDAETVRVWKLLELQRHAQLMYTSCGWFFDDVSGIETVQVLRYAGAVVQQAREILGLDLEAALLERLSRAKSNRPERGDAARIYVRSVRPAMVDHEKLAAHYAISSLFDGYSGQARLYCYDTDRADYRTFQAGKARFAVGRVRLTSRITRESSVQSFGVLHMGDHNVNGGVREFRGAEAFEAMVQEAVAAFERFEFPEVIRLMDRHFGEPSYSLRSLFHDEQRRILGLILDATLEEVHATYRRLYEHHVPLMRFLGELGVPLPKALAHAAELVVNARLRQVLREDPIDPERARALLDLARRERVALDRAGLGYELQQRLEGLIGRLQESPADVAALAAVEAAVDLARASPFEVSLWRVQNTFYRLLRTVYAEQATRDDAAAREWIARCRALGEKLAVRMPEPVGAGRP